MTEEAAQQSRRHGHNIVIELLIFLPVFLVASIVESLILIGPLLYWILFESDFVSSVMEKAMEFMSGGSFGDYMNGVMEATVDLMNGMPEWLVLVQLFATLGMIGVTFLFCRFIEKRKLTTLGFRKGNILPEYLVGALIGGGMLTAVVGIEYLCGAVRFTPGNFSIGIWLLYLLGFMIQGASEEILCRGYLMTSIARKSPMWAAILANSLIFAVLHLLNPGMNVIAFVDIFLSGCIFSVYVARRGNLWGACAMHTFWNFCLGNVFGINVSGMPITTSILFTEELEGNSLITGGVFGLEGGIVSPIVQLAVLLLMLFFLPAKKSELAPEPVFVPVEPVILPEENGNNVM